MPDWDIQKGVAITDATPTGVAGGYLNTNFEALRNEAPFNSAAAPTATDDSTAGFFAGSHWFDTTTQTMWVCTDATASAAVWRSLLLRDSNNIELCPEGDGDVIVVGRLGVNDVSPSAMIDAKADLATTIGLVVQAAAGQTADNVQVLDNGSSELFVIESSGRAIFQNSINSTTGFQVLDANGGKPMFIVDTQNQRVGVNTASPEELLEVSRDGTTSATAPVIQINNTHKTIDPGQTFGALQWRSNDVSNFGTGISGFIKNVAINAGNTTALTFGTRTPPDSVNAQERVRIDPEGNVGIGTTVMPAAGSGKTLVFGDNGGNPTPGANTAGVFAKDVSGTVELFAADEAGNVTQLSPHNPEGEWEFFSRNSKTGKTVRVNMEKFIRRMEELTGEQFIFEE